MTDAGAAIVREGADGPARCHVRSIGWARLDGRAMEYREHLTDPPDERVLEVASLTRRGG